VTERLEADYLVVGSGAMGMAFADVLLAETDATIAMVDRHGKPGGHWNDAYPFVRLHQPSAFYGVNSTPLGTDTKDATGWNQGLYELASGAEVCAYFDQVMLRRFRPSGRVRYFPMCEHEGGGRFRSLVSGNAYQVDPRRRTVEATYMNVRVPAACPPRYAVDPGVACVPPNELPRRSRPEDGYVVVGAGKTGMDACLWLLEQGADPGAITWIMPRDAWLLDRANIQPGPEFFQRSAGGFAREMEAIASAASIDAVFEAMEELGQLLRFDDRVRPTMYRCATVTRLELEQLRRIRNVVRMGRVTRIAAHSIELERGSIKTTPRTLHVDCSADGLERRPAVPVFAEDRITLQSVRTCQQVFSAAFIAHVEAAYADDEHKNELCTPVPHPDSDVDFLRTTLENTRNTLRWAQDPKLQAWIAGARLDLFSRFVGPATATPEQFAVLWKLAGALPRALANLERLLSS
jgi:hypothetical protein